MQKLEPCSDTLAAGGQYLAKSQCTLTVHDNAAGDRFSFFAHLTVHKPDGTQVVIGTSGPHTVGGGGKTVVNSSVGFGLNATLTKGKWTTRLRVTAQNIDEGPPPAPTNTVFSEECPFNIADIQSSSSSSSSSSA
jgi:hypothetical protein